MTLSEVLGSELPLEELLSQCEEDHTEAVRDFEAAQRKLADMRRARDAVRVMIMLKRGKPLAAK